MKFSTIKIASALFFSAVFITSCSDKYDNRSEFINGFATVNLNGKYGVINDKGQEIVPCKYEFVSNYVDGLAKVKMNNKVGLIDTQGKEVVSPKYDKISLFNKGMAKVELNKKFGYLGKDGKEIVPCKFEAVNYNFVQGYFELAENGIVKRVEKEEIKNL
jgi:hypothetical protein